MNISCVTADTVGVPVISPVAGLIVSPLGRIGDTVHVNGDVHVVQLSPEEYDAPTVPEGRLPSITGLCGVGVGIELTPIPLNGTDCGLPAALSATKRVADSAEVKDGVNVMLNEQLLPDPRVELQVFVCEKSAVFVPPIEMAVMLSVAPPYSSWSPKAGPSLCLAPYSGM